MRPGALHREPRGNRDAKKNVEWCRGRGLAYVACTRNLRAFRGRIQASGVVRYFDSILPDRIFQARYSALEISPLACKALIRLRAFFISSKSYIDSTRYVTLRAARRLTTLLSKSGACKPFLASRSSWRQVFKGTFWARFQYRSPSCGIQCRAKALFISQ